MKINTLTLSFVAMALTVGLGSCSLINKSSAANSSANGSYNVAGQTAAGNKHQSTVKKSVATGLEKDIAGEWAITKVGDIKVTVEEDAPYLTFAPAEGRFYSSNGCNILNGSYKVVSANTLEFANVLSTMRFCADVPFEQGISSVLTDGNKVKVLIKQIGKETYMYFNNNSGKALLTLVRHNMQFLDGQWQVTAINGKRINDEEANIFIDVASLKVHGNTGCNYFNGEILINPDEPNSISFSGMGVTRMTCPNIAQERLMLVALEETTSAVKVNDNTVAFANSRGQQVLTLTRSNKSADK